MLTDVRTFADRPRSSASSWASAPSLAEQPQIVSQFLGVAPHTVRQEILPGRIRQAVEFRIQLDAQRHWDRSWFRSRHEDCLSATLSELASAAVQATCPTTLAAELSSSSKRART